MSLLELRHLTSSWSNAVIDCNQNQCANISAKLAYGLFKASKSPDVSQRTDLEEISRNILRATARTPENRGFYDKLTRIIASSMLPNGNQAIFLALLKLKKTAQGILSNSSQNTLPAAHSESSPSVNPDQAQKDDEVDIKRHLEAFLRRSPMYSESGMTAAQVLEEFTDNSVCRGFVGKLLIEIFNKFDFSKGECLNRMEQTLMPQELAAASTFFNSGLEEEIVSSDGNLRSHLEKARDFEIKMIKAFPELIEEESLKGLRFFTLIVFFEVFKDNMLDVSEVIESFFESIFDEKKFNVDIQMVFNQLRECGILTTDVRSAGSSEELFDDSDSEFSVTYPQTRVPQIQN